MSINLIIGAGNNRARVVCPHGSTEDFSDDVVTTIDINPDRNPDIVHDLNVLPLPFENDRFDQIHAYHVLEHLGTQGDYKSFFNLFSEMWRIIKKDGLFCASFPRRESVWALGDPSHTRIMQPEQFLFLNQEFMHNECDVKKTASSDFRYLYKADFKIEYLDQDSDNHYIMLKAIK